MVSSTFFSILRSTQGQFDNLNLIKLLGVCISSHQKDDYANCDQFVSTFDVDYKTIQHVFIPNLKLFGPTNTKLQTKEVGEFLLGYAGKWAGGHSFAHHMAAAM